MYRNGRIGGKQGRFDRIVALLLALADLAERAAGAPLPVRWLVLWALQEADMVVREYVEDRSAHAAGLWIPAVITVRYGSEPADAINLALSLRMLARAVQTIAAYAGRPSLARLGDAIVERVRDRLPGGTANAILCIPLAASLIRPDTS